MTDAISLTESQLQKILTAIEALNRGGVHWEQVIPVFLSALLGFLVGIGLEYVKTYREKAKSAAERSKREVEQINATISAVAFNLESLIHITVPFIIPYFHESHDAYRVFLAVKDDNNNLSNFLANLQNYQSLMTTVPEPLFIEVDVIERLPFIVGKNPDLLKVAAWTNNFTRTLKKAICDKHKYIDITQAEIFKGGLKVQQVGMMLQALEAI
jgi:hypothetical protein